MQTKYVDVKGIRTRYLEAGAGDPLLLIHGGHFGLHTSANVYDLTIPHLARHFHVFAIDKIGCGFTDNPKQDSDYVIGSGVRHARDFLGAMKLGPVHLVGHSRGGFQSCRLAVDHPEMVSTLTIADSGTMVIGETVAMDIYDVTHKKAPTIADPRERFRSKLADYSFSDIHLTDAFIDHLLQIAALPKSKVAAAKMEAGLKDRFKTDLVARQRETYEAIVAGRLKPPTLIVWGADDPAAPLESAGLDVMRLIFAAVPKSQMCVLNRAGHFCFREQPEAFAAAVTDFIKLNS